MSIWGNVKQTLKDSWHGSNHVYGDLIKTSFDTAQKIPLVGDWVPDGSDAKDVAEDGMDAVGVNPDYEQNNAGAKIGTILGGLGGIVGGPAGIGMGAALGSSAGGWLGSLF